MTDILTNNQDSVDSGISTSAHDYKYALLSRARLDFEKYFLAEAMADTNPASLPEENNQTMPNSTATSGNGFAYQQDVVSTVNGTGNPETTASGQTLPYGNMQINKSATHFEDRSNIQTKTDVGLKGNVQPETLIKPVRIIAKPVSQATVVAQNYKLEKEFVRLVKTQGDYQLYINIDNQASVMDEIIKFTKNLELQNNIKINKLIVNRQIIYSNVANSESAERKSDTSNIQTTINRVI